MKVTVEKVVEIEVSLEDVTDEDLLKECETRGIGQPEAEPEDLSDEEVRAEFEHRFGVQGSISVEQMADELYRSRTDAPQIVKDYIYEQTGRTLP